MDSFYVILPSNSATEGNKTSRYTVKLPDILELDSSWTVALSSVIYPHSFHSMGIEEEPVIWVKVIDPGNWVEEKWDDDYHVRIDIPPTTYETVEQLEIGLNEAINREFIKK